MNESYNCGLCGESHPDRDAYIRHLVDEHPETWLAQRSIREQAARERQARNRKTQ